MNQLEVELFPVELKLTEFEMAKYLAIEGKISAFHQNFQTDEISHGIHWRQSHINAPRRSLIPLFS